MNKTDIIISQRSDTTTNNKCLESLKKHTSNYRLVYINHTNFNDSNHLSHPEVIPIWHPYDCFSDQWDDYNLALKYMFEIRHTDADYIVLMSDNIILSHNWLSRMQELFKKDHKIMGVIPLSDYLLKYYDRKENFPMLRLPFDFDNETFEQQSNFFAENYEFLFVHNSLPHIGCIILSREALKEMKILNKSSDKISNKLEKSRYNIIKTVISLGTYIKIKGE